MVEVYLVNGFSFEISMERSSSPCIIRDNLTVVPDVILYNKTLQFKDTYVFTNNSGASISIQKMADYKNKEEAIESFEKGSKEYDDTYLDFKVKVNNLKKDSDWNMLLIIDNNVKEPIVSHGYVVINSFDINDYQTFNYIDSTIIFQTLKVIQEFIKKFKQGNNLSKIDSFLLGYYLELINSIAEPSVFLINEEEISYIQQYYDIWKIEKIINNLLSSITSIIEVYDFTVKYESNKKSKVISKLFSILTIILGFTSLYNFFKEYYLIRIILIIVFGLISLFVLILSSKDIYIYLKEQKEYKNKIKKEQ